MRLNIEAELNRLKAWIHTIKTEGAPHQQQGADDTKVLIDHVQRTSDEAYAAADAELKASVVDLTAQLEISKANIASLIDERDALDTKCTELLNRL